ncbi:MAG: DUF3450 family protein [Phycisphaeraceae bacterium]
MKRITLHPRFALAASAALVCVAALHAPAQDQAPAEPAIDDTRLLLDRWIEVRKTIAKERSEWALGKQILLDRIDLLKRSIVTVQEEIETQKTKLTGFDANIAKLQAQNEKLKGAAEELEKLVEQMESRTLALLKGAPAPLMETVKPLAVQLPGYTSKTDNETQAEPETESPASDAGSTDAETDAESAESEADEEPAGPPLSRRVENVVGVLYLFNRYAGKIDQQSELVQRDDGTSLSVSAMYLGTSYGYYVDDENKTAAAGWPGESEWTWSAIDADATGVRRAIQVFNKDQPAAFVGLPVEVK